MKLVFLHGWLGSSMDWFSIISSLQPLYSCKALDLPGHGTHGGDDEGTQSISNVMTWLGENISDPEVILIGYSMGGRLAVEWARRNPERVRGMVLMSSRPGLPSEQHAARTQWEQNWVKQMESDWNGFIHDWYQQPLFASNPIYTKRRENNPEQMIATFVNWSPTKQDDAWSWLTHCPCPLLYIAGKQDVKYADLANTLPQKNPDRRVEVLEDAGHAVHLDQPQECGALIQQFLESNRETLWP